MIPLYNRILDLTILTHRQYELRELRLGGWVSRLGTIDDGAPLFKAVTIPGMLGELLPRAVNGRSTYRLYIQTAQMPHKYTDNH